MLLQGKKIVLGITGSIAAYKAAFLVRQLIKEGAEVKVVMTSAAMEFVAPLTFSVLSKNPVYCELSTPNGEWNNHVELANWADFILIAPASANTIAKLAVGICDNLLLAVSMAAPCPIFIAPAMDREMSSHFSVRSNLKTLQNNKINVIPAEDGELASGLYGEGRMAEPENILAFLKKKNSEILPLAGKTVLVSAGPTFESIDPVRFIGNHSSGKMGIAIAEALARLGARVTLIHGPIQLVSISKSINTVPVTTAQEMFKACLEAFPQCGITVMTAAVADYKPEKVEAKKIKKSENPLILKLTPTEDILAELGRRKKKNQILVGFALETNNELENARIKLKKKNLDAIVLNSLKNKNTGPGSDFNKVTILDKQNKLHKFGFKSKVEVAKDIVDFIMETKGNEKE